MKTFPTLYKKSSSGAVQQWSIEVQEETGCALIVTTHGQVGGKLQQTGDTIWKGKNEGKSNATNCVQQAESEAEAKFNKQIERKGYVADIEKAKAGENDQAGFISPMLAHKYADRGAKYAKFPGYCQRKYDGIRIIAVIEDGEVSLWSRERKPIISLPHIVKYLEVKFKDESIILDGEGYHCDYHDRFEEIVSFIKQQKTPKPGHEIVQLHVYDVPSHPGTFKERFEFLKSLKLDGPLVEVPTYEVRDEDELDEYFNLFLTEKYEGAIFRNSEGLYVSKRSSDLLKLKVMSDDDFKIVGVKAGRGKMAGKAIFQCEAGNGELFDVKMKGSLDSLIKYLHDRSLWDGKKLVVQYQNLSSAGIPRFPVGLYVRENGL